MVGHAVSLEVVCDAEAAQGSSNADVGVVGACVSMQIGGCLGHSPKCQVVRRCDGNHVQVGREADGNHVSLETTTHADASVEAAGDYVCQCVVDHDVEHHVRVRLVKACKPWRDDGSRRDPQRVDAERAGRLPCGFPDLANCGIHLKKEREYSLVEQFATRRWRDAACRAIQQARAKPTLELPDRLAERGRRQAQMLRCPGETSPFDHGNEGFQLGEFEPAQLCIPLYIVHPDSRLFTNLTLTRILGFPLTKWSFRMNALTLPEPIAAYFAAEHNPQALAHCFTAQAVVKDDGRTYTGLHAIQEFMTAASAKYDATSVPFALDREGAIQVVRAKVRGNFPGSPIDLSYRFQLERGLIASLEITA
jgi:hypothetical protein